MKKYNVILSIAGSDSSGSAGVQADIKTISACGGFASTAITTVTVQNTQGVTQVFPIPSNIICEQIQSVLSDIDVKAIKIGMLYSAQIISEVAEVLKNYSHIPIVLDPVMVSAGGDVLLEKEAICSLKENLFPLATLITPNIEEIELLMGRAVLESEYSSVAQEISEKYSVSTLLKGQNIVGDLCQNVFFSQVSNKIFTFQYSRVHTNNVNGAGCSLSSTIATFLGKGMAEHRAVEEAQSYIYNAVKSGSEYSLGHGKGPINHFWKSFL